MWHVTPSMKYLQGQNRNQTYLFPVSLEDSIKFDNKAKNCYVCPQGKTLTTTGKWHQAKTYLFKRYTTRDCLSCPAKPLCSKAKYGKGIQRSEYQELIEKNKQRVEQNQNYYKRRQAIVEHPYGTLKRQWGFNYIITKKSIKKASADIGLMMTAYNLRRIINIIGKKELKAWLSSLTSAFIRIFKQITTHKFSLTYSFIQTENHIIIFGMPSKTLNLA